MKYLFIFFYLFCLSSCTTFQTVSSSKQKKQKLWEKKSKSFYAKYMYQHLDEEYWDKNAAKKFEKTVLRLYSKAGFGCEMYRTERECGVANPNFCKRYKNINTCWKIQKRCGEKVSDECKSKYPR